MVKKLQFLSILLFLVFCFSTVLADDGKIVGNVTDAETGEPLPGTNVYIEGTTLGAAVDMDGFFLILNVSPGVYTVIANIIGYKEVRMTGVDIAADATTQLNFVLEATTLESAETIVIEAERPIIRKDISATQIELSTEHIKSTPTGSVTELLNLQAGFEITQDVDKGAGLAIRGGEIRESDFRVDNISMKSNLTDVSFMTVPKTSIKNIQLLTGGFNAEYGQVRSGLLNVTTDQGSDKYYLAIDYRHAYPQYKHFGPDAYAKDGRIWQMFAGSQAFTGITTDDVALFYETNGAQGYPLTFEGWNSVSERYLQDNDPDNDLTPQEALELWKWRHRGREYADEPDYDFDATFSGPLPFVKDTYFSTSYRREQRLYAYPLSKKKAVTNMFSLKLNSQITNKLKLGFTGMYGD
ncbi:TonB-dependent receptor, partial [bacterium]|nr:TonB-dependent receptor [bacterium]